ncbi:hypothetical protein ANN_16837 [Periplaneta americana]|uniref:Mos1 transposase HTH domain-containing protein n=1 Tax=Periplaneta americana TaxID=6978 RepID=A0ABQ8SR77_PERAM|nr:hypothetical protein ANN_16837 [Periplaneta americana]
MSIRRSQAKPISWLGPKLPDLTPPDFFVWGFVKDIVYSQKPRKINDLRVKITQAFQQITPLMLQRTWAELHHRYELSTGFLNMCSHNVVSTGCNKSPLCILCYFKTNDVIDNPADCEVRSVSRFLNARHLKPAEIYRQLKEVYGDTVMNERNVRKWCEMFNNGRTNVHDETRPGRPSLITEDLKTKVNDRILQDRRTSLDELHIAFPDISRSLLGENVSQHHGYHKICARPHTAASTRELLDQFGWEIFDHPPYSLDLAPSDFHLFTKLKDFLGGTRFGKDEELKRQ